MEILDYAIKMEMDGEKFYLELAERNKDNKLNVVFKSLASDEAHHAKIIKDKKHGITTSLDGGAQATIKNVFSGSDFKIESSSPEQVDAYKGALDKEQESIDLYKKLLSESDKDKKLFTFFN